MNSNYDWFRFSLSFSPGVAGWQSLGKTHTSFGFGSEVIWKNMIAETDGYSDPAQGCVDVKTAGAGCGWAADPTRAQKTNLCVGSYVYGSDNGGSTSMACDRITATCVTMLNVGESCVDTTVYWQKKMCMDHLMCAPQAFGTATGAWTCQPRPSGITLIGDHLIAAPAHQWNAVAMKDANLREPPTRREQEAKVGGASCAIDAGKSFHGAVLYKIYSDKHFSPPKMYITYVMDMAGHPSSKPFEENDVV